MRKVEVGQRAVDGFTALTLSSATAGGIEAAFVPEAGMVGCSLGHRGEELLGQRGGLATYVARRSTMGIPLLHPWANRLRAMRFDVAGRQVDLDSGEARPSLDPNGLPWYVKVMPKPAPEPWQKITSKQRLALYQQSTFSGLPSALISSAGVLV